MPGEKVTQEERWYYAQDSKRIGPFTLEELLEKLPDIDGSDTWVRGPGVKRWTRAVDVPGLDPEDADQPNPLFWLSYLFFRPTLFFRHFVIKPFPPLTVVCAWTYGMAAVIDRMEMKFAWGRDVPYDETWGAYWTFVVLAGIIAGLMYFAIGGWWYRIRLGWAGAREVESALARRVYLFASQVYAIPSIMAVMLETSHFENPAAAWEGESLWYLALTIFPFWSVWNSYVGVRTAFVVPRGGARLWFLILPCVVYLLTFCITFGLFMLPAGNDEPDLENPQEHRSSIVSFSFPGNWCIDRNHPDHDPECDVFVESIRQDAIARIMVYPSEKTIEEELATSLKMYRENSQEFTEVGSFQRLGAFDGTGRTARGLSLGAFIMIRVFIAPLDDGVFLEVQEVWGRKEEPSVHSGFELLRSTLEVKHP